jgi:hypothetical protein
MGYSAGSRACIMSFNRWQTLIAARMAKAVGVGMVAAS